MDIQGIKTSLLIVFPLFVWLSDCLSLIGCKRICHTGECYPAGILPTDRQREALGESVPESLIAFHPIRRIATREEVVAMVRYLSGPQGGYITGGIIDIAGGLSTGLHRRNRAAIYHIFSTSDAGRIG